MMLSSEWLRVSVMHVYGVRAKLCSIFVQIFIPVCKNTHIKARITRLCIMTHPARYFSLDPERLAVPYKAFIALVLEQGILPPF